MDVRDANDYRFHFSNNYKWAKAVLNISLGIGNL